MEKIKKNVIRVWTTVGNWSRLARMKHQTMDMPCGLLAGHDDLRSRHSDNWVTNCRVTLPTSPSARGCECRLACRSRRDRPHSKCRCCGRCSDGHVRLSHSLDGRDRVCHPCDVEVVADALETSCLVTGFQLLYCEILVDSSGTAVYHNQVNSSRILHLF